MHRLSDIDTTIIFVNAKKVRHVAFLIQSDYEEHLTVMSFS